MNGGNSGGSFWGSARDIGIVTVAVLTFSGALYTATYLGELGIDFSIGNVAPIALLVSASRVALGIVSAVESFVFHQVFWTSVIAVVVVVCVIALTRARKTKGVRRLRALLRSRMVQVTLVVVASVLIFVASESTARNDVAVLRARNSQYGPAIQFAKQHDSGYPYELLQGNACGNARVVLVASDVIYVMVQPTPPPGIAELPLGRTYSVRRSDLLSTMAVLRDRRLTLKPASVPPKPTPRPPPKPTPKPTPTPDPCSKYP